MQGSSQRREQRMEIGTSDRTFRSGPGPLTGLMRLLGRSLTNIGPVLLITVSAFSGFAVRPVIDELVKGPESLRELANGLRQAALNQFYGVPVIFPDPAPTKLKLDTAPENNDETRTSLQTPETVTTKFTPKITPLIPGMGIPKPVKTVRINAAGSIITEPYK